MSKLQEAMQGATLKLVGAQIKASQEQFRTATQTAELVKVDTAPEPVRVVRVLRSGKIAGCVNLCSWHPGGASQSHYATAGDPASGPLMIAPYIDAMAYLPAELATAIEGGDQQLAIDANSRVTIIAKI